jgi:hypothetical protein
MSIGRRNFPPEGVFGLYLKSGTPAGLFVQRPPRRIVLENALGLGEI